MIITPNEDLIMGPKYSKVEVPAGYCARYARKAVEDMFGIVYPTAHAWLMRTMPGVEAIRIESRDHLTQLVEAGEVKPGMLFGFQFPLTSKENAEAARKAGADYTHLGALIDIDSDGELYFADKFGSLTRRRRSLGNMTFWDRLKPKEVLRLS